MPLRIPAERGGGGVEGGGRGGREGGGERRGGEGGGRGGEGGGGGGVEGRVGGAGLGVSEYASTGKTSLIAHVKPSFAAEHLELGGDVRVVMVRRSVTDPQVRAIPGIAAALPGTFSVAAIGPAPDADHFIVDVGRSPKGS